MDNLTVPEPSDTQAATSEPTPEPTQPVWSEPQYLAPPAVSVPTKKSIGTGKILLGVGALVSMALGGGVGAYIVHGKTQHNQQVLAQARAAASAGTKQVSQTAGERSDGSHYGPLFAYLLPIPAGDTLGPDDGDFGDNSSLTSTQITSDIDGLLSGLPQSDMSSARGSLADLQIKNLAVRTYTDTSAGMVVEIALVQVDVSDATQTANAFTSMISDLNVFRQGPSVPGYSQAECVLPPGLGSDTLDSMICTASSGDIEVRVDAYGTAPLDQDAIAQLVSQQLDLLKTNQTIG